jgi:hypothetical protein
MVSISLGLVPMRRWLRLGLGFLTGDLMADVSDVHGGAFGVLPVGRRSGACEAQVPMTGATLEGFGGVRWFRVVRAGRRWRQSGSSSRG